MGWQQSPRGWFVFCLVLGAFLCVCVSVGGLGGLSTSLCESAGISQVHL